MAEWAVHKEHALKAGVRRETIDALICQEQPRFQDEHEEAVYRFSTELHRSKFVSDTTFALAERALGRSGIVDLIGILGYYTLISMTLNAFRVAAPKDSKQDF
jgi:4-carboxymuconolactone decarboxylase